MSRSRTEIVGRRREVAILQSMLNDACEGDVGVAVLSGEAGIGKTRLLEELSALASRRSCLTLEGVASEFERELPFGPFIEAFDAFLTSLDPRVLDRLSVDRLGALGAVFPSLRRLDSRPEEAVNALERFRIHQAVRELIERLAAIHPVVLILDDLQWADTASVELIGSLMRHPPQAEVMVALAVRPGPEDTGIRHVIDANQTNSILHVIEVGPLSEADVAMLVDDRGGIDMERLHHDSGGNPFYALQLARFQGGSLGDDGLHGSQVPPAVGRTIAAELAGLTEEARALAETAAVVGDPFDLDAVSAISGHTESETLELIDELVAADLLRETQLPRRFRFRHPVVRSAVYAWTPHSVRTSHHRRAAEVLTEMGASGTMIAGHLEHCAGFGDMRAVRALRAAAEEVVAKAPASAARWYGTALRLMPSDAPNDEIVDLVVAVAASLTVTGRFGDALDTLEVELGRAARDAREPSFGLVMLAAATERLLGRHHEALERLEALYARMGAEGTIESASLMIALVETNMFLSDPDGMMRWGRMAVDTAEQLDDEAVLAAALVAHTLAAAFGGSTELAMDLHARASELVDRLPDEIVTRRLDALGNLTLAELYLDLHGAGCLHGERALSLARRSGQTQVLPTVTPILGMSLAMVGAMQRSAEVLDDAIESARLAGNDQAIAMNLFNRALVAVWSGEVDTALVLAKESLALAASVDNGVVTAFAGAILAQAILESGDGPGALHTLLSNVGGEEIPFLSGTWRSTFFEVLVRCLIECGDLGRASSVVDRARRHADHLDLGLGRLMADRAEAWVALARGDPNRAFRLARDAADEALRIGARIHAPSSRVIAAQALLMMGRADEAVGQLHEARSEFALLGATHQVERLERELVELGHTLQPPPPARPGGSGVGDLTARELEVSTLIVDRRTNREISEILFLSTKTVETHVRNIFKKLGVGSRVDVANIVSDHLAGGRKGTDQGVSPMSSGAG